MEPYLLYLNGNTDCEIKKRSSSVNETYTTAPQAFYKNLKSSVNTTPGKIINSSEDEDD